MVVPGELQNRRSHQNDSRRERRPLVLVNHNIERKRNKRDLPGYTHNNVEHVAEEIFVALEAWILGKHLLQDRSPEPPRPHPLVEVDQHCIVFLLGQQRTRKASNQRDPHHDGEDENHFHVDRVSRQQMLNYRYLLHDRRHPQRRRNPRHHAPEIAPPVKPPPVPLQHVRCRVAAP